MKHLIKLALVLLAGTAAYFVFEFVNQVAAFGVALFASGSLVATYVGLAFAPIPQAQRRRATLVAQVAMGIEAAYGFLYVLSLQSPDVFARPLNIWLSVPLALLHGGAFSVLAYFVSLFVVHGQDEMAQSGALTIAEQRDLVIVEALEKLTARLEAPAAPQLTDDGAERITVDGKSISLRQLSRQLGTPLTTLRRKMDQAGAADEEA
jgi:hypothetical protein